MHCKEDFKKIQGHSTQNEGKQAPAWYDALLKIALDCIRLHWI